MPLTGIKEQGPEYYAEAMSARMYTKSWRKTSYHILWEWAVDILGDVKIYELGCGTGQFAEMCFEKGIDYIGGSDFCESNIINAKLINEDHKEVFEVADAYKVKLPPSDVVVVMFEMLEHLRDDAALMKRLMRHRVAFSVPSYGDISHVRVYLSEEEIRQRFRGILEIEEIKVFQQGDGIFGDKRWLYGVIANGIRKDNSSK